MSPAVAFLQFGVLLILGGASLVTSIEAATNDRDLSTLRSHFSIVCDAVRVAGAVDGDVSPTPAPITTTQAPQIPDPA
ncbi:hypothetical protein TCAL_02458 [Tigriopus californicus]|uniref:Secreted protein n=1 Tax=Tigriopus californicus TaxID=6832 RepID=A0A553NTE3_TIGCA|nr:hypothetical protein TCAL_02458 [Tigriopus californicus]|eukprot:TCALIF_02458-PA protein Name:"Protein of unknown function" AED:0.45 eAED:0.45 QI:160/0/0.5/0.5/1/1/2/0/77